MPSLDNSAATNAQNLLNGIDYGALIGGPLQAAITAQATAARSTWEFIQEVGLNTDDDGNKTAVNVTFMYQKDGEMVRLVVPILTIVPIPMIVIDEVDIQFKANINASASSSSEESESENVNASMSGKAKAGWGPFSVSVKVQAGYSSKKDSKATQDSRYSVEYTQDVHVHASQADMPAGLATVLNILSNSATGGSRDGELLVTPAMGSVNIADPDKKQHLQITVKDPNGLLVPQAGVKIDKTTIPDYISIGKGPLGVPVSSDDLDSLTTDEKGKLSLLFWVDPQHASDAAGKPPFEADITASIGNGQNASQKQARFPVRITGVLPGPGPGTGASIDVDQSSLSVANGSEKTLKATLKDADGNPVSSATAVTVMLDDSTVVSLKKGTTAISSGDNADTTASGVLSLKVKGDSAGQCKITLSASVGGSNVSKDVPVTVT